MIESLNESKRDDVRVGGGEVRGISSASDLCAKREVKITLGKVYFFSNLTIAHITFRNLRKKVQALQPDNSVFISLFYVKTAKRCFHVLRI